ncbi:MAG: hypothetical protein MMC23_001022 [Stictis urceolatum]|nr:hypothetical protein [Stictis urceolata]
MASRFFGSKPSKSKTKADLPAERPSALPKRTSIPSAPAKSSKILSQPTSSLPRGRTTRATAAADKQAVRSAQAPLIKKETAIDSLTRKPSLREQQQTNTALARAVDAGMGTHTEITSKPLPQRNRLRRKASSVDQRSQYAQSEPSDTSHEPVSHYTASEGTSARGYADPFPGSILGISMPVPNPAPPQRETTPTEHATSNSRMASYALKQPHKISTTDLPPPTPNFAGRSSSSSTRYSESPGPFSRTSTPTSASSQSPGVLQVHKFTPTRPRPSLSPTRSRPPVTKRKIPGQHEEGSEQQGLTALRESQTSSSSSSTVKGTDIIETAEGVRTARRAKRDQTPPTPPLRLSSKRGRDPRPLITSTALTPDSATTTTTDVSKPRPLLASRLARPSQSLSSPLSQSVSKPPAPGLPRPKPTPSRPSREDVPPLNSGEPSVIVKSNLNHLVTSGHKRRESAEKNILGSPLRSVEKPSKHSRSPSTSSTTNFTSKRASITSPHLTSSVNKKETPALRTDIQLKPKEPTPTSASPSKSSSRFGLFSRRVKSPSETSLASPPEKSEKLVKKGPAAGTGHEGYGKYARRGRSGSTSTAASRGRSTSADRHSQSFARPPSSRKSSFGSNGEKPELDDFYKERLEPVVIGGGGKIRENRNSQSSLYQTTSGQTSQASVDTGSYLTSRSRITQDTSAGPSSVASSQRVSRELLPAPVLATAPGKLPEQRTLAHRRSLHRSQLFGEGEAMRIPPPINTKVLAPSPVLDTYDSTLSSAPRTDASIATDDVSEGHEGNWLKPKKKKTAQKSKLTRKWNFFNPLRSRSPERRESDLERKISHENEVATASAPFQEPRSVAHYAMLEDDEPEQEQNLEQILRNIEGNLEMDNSQPDSNVLRVQRDHKMSMLLPSPPKFPTGFDNSHRPASPKVPLNQSPPRAEAQSINSVVSADVPDQTSVPVPVRRPSRLQQVGRIPRVVSKRDRLHNPAPHSFSRPFKRSVDESSGSQSAVERPTLGLNTDLSPPENWNPFAKPASAPPANSVMFGMDQSDEFLRFSPRKDSGVSGSSSSGILSLAPVTAVAPPPQAAFSEDDVWNEYDELLDNVGHGLPSLDSTELESMIASFPSLSNMRSPPPASNRESPLMSSEGSSDTARAHSPKMAQTIQPTGPSNLPLPPQPGSSALASPISFTDLYANYGDRSHRSSVAKSNPRHSVTSIESGSRYSSQTMVSGTGSHSSHESERTKRVTQVMAEKTHSTASHSLRFSALMTSRWLSFDRVLFSPAQEEVLMNKQNRVLVLDGLQNDDWSAYCALTYPETIIYNLASFSKNRQSADTSNSDSWTPPPNLRRVSHTSIAAPFPFPKGFFTAVVFRFPAASTPSAYRNAISESKRVLRPGGYLEMTVLDMDLVNTGMLARRAVRGVKERIAATSPETSLSPASDTLMKCLGRRGFENLNRCVVGVPVAGSVSGIQHQRVGLGGDDQASSAASASASGTEGSLSLSNLLAGKQGVGGIGSEYTGPKMVARVGRWWWSRCYEKGVLGENVESMWNDKIIVRECERRDTGLRLVVCYAQKPESPRRRTVSV